MPLWEQSIATAMVRYGLVLKGHRERVLRAFWQSIRRASGGLFGKPTPRKDRCAAWAAARQQRDTKIIIVSLRMYNLHDGVALARFCSHEDSPAHAHGMTSVISGEKEGTIIIHIHTHACAKGSSHNPKNPPVPTRKRIHPNNHLHNPLAPPYNAW